MTPIEEAQRAFNRLIQRIPQYAGTQEVDDINTVQAALSKLRAMQDVDVEVLKRDVVSRLTPLKWYQKTSNNLQARENATSLICSTIDHLHAQGYLSKPEPIEGLGDALEEDEMGINELQIILKAATEYHKLTGGK